MSSPRRVRYAVTLSASVVEGPAQEVEAVTAALIEQLDDLGTLFAQDDDHDDETEYRIEWDVPEVVE